MRGVRHFYGATLLIHVRILYPWRGISLHAPLRPKEVCATHHNTLPLEHRTGFEPARDLLGRQTGGLLPNRCAERHTGIEPVSPPWQGGMRSPATMTQCRDRYLFSEGYSQLRPCPEFSSMVDFVTSAAHPALCSLPLRESYRIRTGIFHLDKVVL